MQIFYKADQKVKDFEVSLFSFPINSRIFISDWGEYITWFTPIDNTNTFGRGNFSIHGGSSPGSAGCIDLTEDNYKLHQWFLKLNKSLVSNIQY